MKISSLKSQEKQDKRNLIIDVAANLFSEYGFHEVNMEMVAQKAGIAKGTIYNYFKSKEDLYFEINESRLSRLLTELEKKFNEQISVLDDLKGFVIHVFMFLLKYRDFFLIFQRTRLKKQQLKSKSLEEKIQRLKDLLSNILTEGIQKKVFKELNVCLTADLILGMIYAAVLRNMNRDIHDEVIIKEREELFNLVRDSVIAVLSSNPPLDGKTILITRSMGQSKQDVNELIKLGAEIIELPTLKIVPPTSWKECDDAIKNFNDYSTVIFTSQNAVEWFLNRLELFDKTNDLKSKKIIAIGSKTEDKLIERGFTVSFKPSKFNGESLVEELKEILQRDEKILLPQSQIGRDLIEKNLSESGFNIKRVSVYSVDLPELEDIYDSVKKLNEKDVDIFVFTSPSTFDNFLKLMNIDSPQNFFANRTIAVIGPTTRKHIESFDIKVEIEPEESTFNSLIKAIINYFQKNV
jgi:uroporphyrinogen-III synthase/DNA-binding transcriptional regulator YbjK